MVDGRQDMDMDIWLGESPWISGWVNHTEVWHAHPANPSEAYTGRYTLATPTFTRPRNVSSIDIVSTSRHRHRQHLKTPTSSASEDTDPRASVRAEQ